MGKNFISKKKLTVIGIILAVISGLILSMGLFTFYYGEGFSYFSKDPTACINCHIMQPQFDSWQKASHHTSATCVECHLPHDFIPKWIAKAENGFWHSKGFTLQDFPEPIFIRKKNIDVLEKNCRECHSGLVHNILQPNNYKNEETQCTHCHKTVGHGATVGMGRLEFVSQKNTNVQGVSYGKE